MENGKSRAVFAQGARTRQPCELKEHRATYGRPHLRMHDQKNAVL